MRLRIVHNAGLNPDRLALHRSPLRSTLIGVVVLAVGVSAILGGANLVGGQPPPFKPYVVFMFLFGGGLSLLGAALIARRIGLDIDRRNATVVAWTS